MTGLSFGNFQERSPFQVRDQNIFRQDVSKKEYRHTTDMSKPFRCYSPELTEVSYSSPSQNRQPYQNTRAQYMPTPVRYEPYWDDHHDDCNREGFLDLPDDFIPPRHGFPTRASRVRRDDVPKVPTEEIHLPHGFVHLRDNDVVCGRGAPTLVHPGNQAYRALIQQHETAYLCAKRADKPIIATEVIETLKNRGVRFVRRERNNKGAGWVILDEKKVYEKICQSLREAAPELRRKILASDARTTQDRPKAQTEPQLERENHPSVLTP